MKKLIRFLSLGSMLALPCLAQQAEPPVESASPKSETTKKQLPWQEGFEEAKKQAGEKKLDLLLEFTGSDWCTFCIQLHDEVFKQPDFIDAVKDKFVFVELDFPQEKKQSEKIAEQNEKLSAVYKVEGYPTIILADSEGRPYARTGYEEGGARPYLERLAEFQQKRLKRDAAWEKASKLEGLEKAKALKESLDAMDEEIVVNFYAKEADEIIALDPEDTLGLKKKRSFDKALAALEEGLDPEKPEEMIKAVDNFIAEQKPVGEQKQILMMMKIQAFAENLDAADALLRDVLKVDETSEVAENARGLIETIRELKAQAEAEKKANAGGK